MKHRGVIFLSLLLTLAMVIGLMPGMGMTAYAAANKTITWDSSNWDGLFSKDVTGGSHTDENGITASGAAFWKNFYNENLVNMLDNGAANFSISNGKFSSIEIKYDDKQLLKDLSTGWTDNVNSLKWTGESNEVTLSGFGAVFVTSIVFTIETADAYSVTLSGGANATTSGGATSQTGLTGAMTTVTYTANSGYTFPAFSNSTTNGVTLTRISDTVVTVSGTPTANVNITVPDAAAIPTYTVTYDANGGSGEMKPTKVSKNDEGKYIYKVESCGFTAPEGETFESWLGSDGKTYRPGPEVEISANLTLTAQWKKSGSDGGSGGGFDLVFNIPGADNSWEYVGGYVAPQQAYRVSLAPMQGGSAALGLTTGDSGTQMNVYPSTTVFVFPNAEQGYTLDKIVWSLIDGSASYDITEAKNFVMPAMDVVVYVTFRPVG